MEASVDPPAATEPVVHMAQAVAANPTPSHAATPNHPSYAEMITAAISDLKEGSGSSRRAIAKYIEEKYSNLPPSHSALLTHHLKRLKSSHLLVMAKRSYMLPGSSPPPPQVQIPSNNLVQAAGMPSFGLPKRRPGRPSKPKPNPYPNPTIGGSYLGAATGSESVLVSLGLVDNPREQFNAGAGSDLGAVVGSDAVLVSSDLVGEPAKKQGRGRPPKVRLLVETGGEAGVVGGKRGRGRPRRPKVVSDVMGRPSKSGHAGGVAVSGIVGGSSGLHVKEKQPGRPRGRPLKKNVEIAATAGGGYGAVLVPISGNDGGVGVAVSGDIGFVAGGSVLPAKRRGRPSKVGVAKKQNGGDGLVNGAGIGLLPVGQHGGPPKVYGAKKPRKLTGKPLGRPRKISSAKEIQAVDSQPLAYQDLWSKFEHFQLKVKQAVSAVKPYLNHETAAVAIGALQELEELATVGAIAPSNGQGQAPLFLDQEKLLHG